jgi:hypothetical protein
METNRCPGVVNVRLQHPDHHGHKEHMTKDLGIIIPRISRPQKAPKRFEEAGKIFGRKAA